MRKDGTLVDVSLNISPVKDSMGKIVGAATIARDITERKQLEQRSKAGIPRSWNEATRNWAILPRSLHTIYVLHCARFRDLQACLRNIIAKRLPMPTLISIFRTSSRDPSECII